MMIRKTIFLTLICSVLFTGLTSRCFALDQVIELINQLGIRENQGPAKVQKILAKIDEALPQEINPNSYEAYTILEYASNLNPYIRFGARYVIRNRYGFFKDKMNRTDAPNLIGSMLNDIKRSRANWLLCRITLSLMDFDPEKYKKAIKNKQYRSRRSIWVIATQVEDIESQFFALRFMSHYPHYWRKRVEEDVNFLLTVKSILLHPGYEQNPNQYKILMLIGKLINMGMSQFRDLVVNVSEVRSQILGNIVDVERNTYFRTRIASLFIAEVCFDVIPTSGRARYIDKIIDTSTLFSWKDLTEMSQRQRVVFSDLSAQAVRTVTSNYDECLPFIEKKEAVEKYLKILLTTIEAKSFFELGVATVRFLTRGMNDFSTMITSRHLQALANAILLDYYPLSNTAIIFFGAYPEEYKLSDRHIQKINETAKYNIKRGNTSHPLFKYVRRYPSEFPDCKQVF